MTSIAAIIDRIASATNAIRTRGEDAERLERHDGEVQELFARMEQTAADLEKVAMRLEAKLT